MVMDNRVRTKWGCGAGESNQGKIGTTVIEQLKNNKKDITDDF